MQNGFRVQMLQWGLGVDGKAESNKVRAVSSAKIGRTKLLCVVNFFVWKNQSSCVVNFSCHCQPKYKKCQSPEPCRP